MQKIKSSQQEHIKKSFDKWENGDSAEDKKEPLKNAIKKIKDQFDFKEEDVM